MTIHREKLGERQPYKNAAIRKESANLQDQKSPDSYLKHSFFGKQKNLITICLPWGCEKLPVETKRATVKSHLSSIIMAAWNWVLEPL